MTTLDQRALEQRQRAQLHRELKQSFGEGVEISIWYRQYRELKAAHPDTLLFYRLGDFYELFDDDAKLVAELLGVTLTRKHSATHKASKEYIYAPMAGIPYKAVENYVARLVERGYRIAVAEQVSETSSSKRDTRPRSVFAGGIAERERGIPSSKEIVEREVVRVITPGTLVDPALLPANRNNYLAAVIVDGARIGLAYADLTTGEFAAAEFSGARAAQQLEGELARLQAAEVLVPEGEALRLPGLAPANARLSQDLAPMTKHEREHLLRHERVARKLEAENATRWTNGHVTALPDWRWERDTARDALLQQFRTRSLGSFGLDDRPLALRAAGAAIQYLRETQRSGVAQITALRAYTSGGYMFLDPQTRRNLELTEGSGGKAKGSLVSVIDQTRTPMGARLLRAWLSQPLLDVEALNRRLDAVQRFADESMLRAELREQMRAIGDMERAVNRILQGTTVATPRDFAKLRESLRALPEVARLLEGFDDLLADAQPDSVGRQHTDAAAEPRGRPSRHSAPPARRVLGDDLFGDDDADEPANNESDEHIEVRLSALSPQPSVLQNGLDTCAEILDLLERAIDDDPPALLGASNYLRSDEGGEKPRRVIRPGYHDEMDKVVQATRDAQSFIDNLEVREREATGIKSLKVGYNEVFHYFIEVSRNDADRVPKHYERKQTLVGSERYVTMQLKDRESTVLRARERLKELEQQIFANLCLELQEHGPRLLAVSRLLARADVYAGLAEVAVRQRFVRPELNDGTALHIVGGRHPVVEQVLEEEFVPNGVDLDTASNQLLLITGPNMAGKSTVMRQIALIVLLAQIGSFVPADEAVVGLADRIFTRIGAQDDIATGQSTFMVEMTETAAILLQSTNRSLIVLDEVGRGTSTYDGMAIARAVIEYIHNEPRLRCRTLFATHYHELTALEGLLPRVKNFHMAAVEQEGQVVFLHELRPGTADRSYGIHVAQLAGIPAGVIRRAAELLAELEAGRAADAPPGSNGKRDARQQRQPAAQRPAPEPAPQPTLFDLAPSPVFEMLRRLNVNELTPIEALTRLYELQKLASQD
jgi:DNA mismatch repair protein MutS